MTRILCTLLVTLVTFSLMAQSNENEGETPADSVQTEPTLVENDTTKTQTPVVKDTTRTPQVKPVPQDTAKTPTPKPIVKDNLPTPQDGENEEPKIIYYQTVKGDRDDDDDDDYRYRYRNDNVKVRNRGSHRDIKTLAGNMSHSGGFGAISFKSTELRDEAIVFAGLRGGWIVNRTLGIGFEAYGAIPTAKFDDIIPESVVTLGGYGGMFLELIFFSNQVIHVTFPVSGGAGYLGYYEDWENANNNYSNDLIDEDIFWYVEPGVDLELNVSRNFRLAGGVSKRFTQDMELINTEAKDFETLSYFLTLKIGSF